MIKAGKLCIYGAPMNRSIAEISVHAQHCPGSFSAEDLATAIKMGLAANLAGSVRDAWQEKARAQTIAMAKRVRELANPATRPYYPGAFGDAIRNAGNVAVANIKASSDAWFDARRAAYREEWQRKQRAYKASAFGLLRRLRGRWHVRREQA
ncbi:hypothetical protein [Sphingomonas soli]|uniref:hypothetical protein n=1 Tax=Sphingomonas soli TaxID=266127 RepID=UPI000836734E|nr:hypothetical protein [Sphingomonas soli]